MQCPVCENEFNFNKPGTCYFNMNEDEEVIVYCECGVEIKIPYEPALYTVLRESIRVEDNMRALKCIKKITGVDLKSAKRMLWAILDK